MLQSQLIADITQWGSPMTGQYNHLGLTRWPFPIVPEREFCTFLADRQQLRLDIAGLLTTLFRRDASSVHLFWSWFGGGKTHTLFYLANQAETKRNNSWCEAG